MGENIMEKLLIIVVSYATVVLDLIGVFIIIIGAVKAVFRLFLNKFNIDNINVKLKLAKSLDLALEFKLAAEILKTVIIQSVDELLILSAVVILRVIMTFVIDWEIKNAEIEISKKDNKKDRRSN